VSSGRAEERTLAASALIRFLQIVHPLVLQALPGSVKIDDRDGSSSMKRMCGVLCLFAGTLASQSITSRIVGTVSDSSGAAVAGAAIVARNVDTNERTESRSGAGGDYVGLPSRPRGSRSADTEAH